MCSLTMATSLALTFMILLLSFLTVLESVAAISVPRDGVPPAVPRGGVPPAVPRDGVPPAVPRGGVPPAPVNKPIIRNEAIKKVHIVFMNHLDVGFNHYLDDVINLYFTKYFPRAVSLSKELRQKGYTETFVYTTHPWLVSMYVQCLPHLNLISSPVQCPTVDELANFNAAVSRGDITWHAGPMNMQFEFLDRSLAEFGVDLSLSLDEKYGIKRQYRTLSQRDVPGLTQALIPILMEKNIVAISVGVNAASSPPAVPRIFNWQYRNSSILAMWHPGGYPDNPGVYPSAAGGLSVDDCVIVPGLEEALCFAFRSDNQGPPENIQEILGNYEVLRAEFPNARLQASRLEDFVAVVYGVRNRLTNITREIGDTWIQGIQSDPRKVSELRIFMRHRTKCLSEGRCVVNDAAFFNSSRLLLKSAEHTWGRNGVSNEIDWSNLAFDLVRHNSDFTNAAISWVAQRQFTYLALDALDDPQLQNEILAEMTSTTASIPDLRGYTLTDDRQFMCDDVLGLEFNDDGYISLLNDVIQKKAFAGDFGRIAYRTYNQTDFDSMDAQYTFRTWFSLGVEKPNMTVNAHPESKFWPTVLIGFYRKPGFCDFYTLHTMASDESVFDYGAPFHIWTHYTSDTNPESDKGVQITVQWFDKRATRLPEAMFLHFRPQLRPGYRWMFEKLGQLVDPSDVVTNGSQRLHAIDQRVVYADGQNQNGLEIVSQDVALVSTITPTLNATVFPLPLNQHEQITAVSFNFFNNIWNVNYVYWYPFLQNDDQNFVARFQMKLMNSRESRRHYTANSHLRRAFKSPTKESKKYEHL